MMTRTKKRKLDDNNSNNNKDDDKNKTPPSDDKNDEQNDSDEKMQVVDIIDSMDDIPRDNSSSDEDYYDDEDDEDYEDSYEENREEEYEEYDDENNEEDDVKINFETIPFPIKILLGGGGSDSMFKPSSSLPTMSKRDILKKKIDDSLLCKEMKEKLHKKLSGCSLDEKQFQWFETFLDIPFGKYAPLPVNVQQDDVGEYFVQLQENLDKAVYGMQTVKEEILNYVAQTVSTTTPSPRILALHGVAGVGKCLHPDTPVMLYSGSIITAKEVKLGHRLMGDDSTPRNVLSVCKGIDPMYKIKQKYRNDYIVNEPHILSLRFIKDFGGYQRGDVFDVSVKDYLELSEQFQQSLRGFSVPCEYQPQPVSFDPYLLGLWLGSLHDNNSVCEVSMNSTISEEVKKVFHQYDMYIHMIKEKKTNEIYRCFNNSFGTVNKMYKFLSMNNLLNNKHIPSQYMFNCMSNRMKLLAGFIDSGFDYCSKKNRYKYTTKNKKLVEDVQFLCRSLGFAVKIRKSWLGVYKCYVFGAGIEKIPVNTDEKRASDKHPKDGVNVEIKISHIGIGEYCGFEIDGNRRFLLGDFTVTHNTKLVREGISKTLNRPFQTFSMGGIRDAQHFTGFDYTYVNSKHGAIAQAMIDSGVMNPVIFLDELDKISSTNEGEEIENLLVHLTDPIQNHDFKDKYFGEFPIDLSKVIFIFAFNHIDKINPILKDRLHIIHIPSPTTKEKIIIAKQYLIDELLKNTGLEKDDFTITDEAFEYIIGNYCKSGGIRQLKRCIETILLKLNTVKLLGESVKKIKLSIKLNSYKPPFTINDKNVKQFLECHKTEEDDDFISHKSMYL